MKPFLGIDLTLDKNNEEFNGKEFLVASASPVLSQALENSVENAEQTLEKSKLPLPLRIAKWGSCIVGLSITAGALKAAAGDEELTLSAMYQAAPWLFWLAGVCLLLWAYLAYKSKRKETEVLEGEEGTQTLAHLDDTCDAIYADLDVPSDAATADVLWFYYKEKDGKVKITEKGLQVATFANPEMRVYTDAENLYLADLEGKYAFSLSNFKAIHTVKKSATILSWNKEEDMRKGEYKPYKLSEDDCGVVTCKSYHILEWEKDGESWGIYVPCYELPIFERFIGLSAE